MSSPANPLFGSWQPPGTVPGAPTPAPPNLTPAGTPGSQNPYGAGTRGSGDLGFNLAQTNLQTGLQKNALIPYFTRLFSGATGPASDFYKQLMTLGSPFYQRKQQQTFEQGTKAAQDAAAQSRQQLQASGAGYTPSGAGAAMFGGEGQAEAGNQEEAFLNNLFQNEQLQLAGAGGLSSLASLFNPTTLATSQISPNIQQPTNTAAELMSGVGSLLGGVFGTGGAPIPG
jgi:hypothetical protein